MAKSRSLRAYTYAACQLFLVVLCAFLAIRVISSLRRARDSSKQFHSFQRNSSIIWPKKCITDGHTPTGVVIIRHDDGTTDKRRLLRRRLGHLESECGYRVVFAVGNISDSLQHSLRMENTQTKDILQYYPPMDEAADARVPLKVFGPWLEEACPSAPAAIVVHYIEKASWTRFYRNSVVYTHVPGKQLPSNAVRF